MACEVGFVTSGFLTKILCAFLMFTYRNDTLNFLTVWFTRPRTGIVSCMHKYLSEHGWEDRFGNIDCSL
jgi:hypothetical protein